MIGGVRPWIWAVTGLALTASAALLLPAARQRTPRHVGRSAARGPEAHPRSSPVQSPGGPSPAAMAVHGGVAPHASAPGPGVASGVSAEPRPASEADDDAALVVDEEAAARAAARLRVPGLETVEGRVALLPPLPGEKATAYARRQDDLRRRLAADALLEEYLARLDYQNTIYPSDYPLEQVREAARSEVRRLSGQARVDLLEEALGGVDALGATPQFAAPSPSLAASAEPPER